MVISPQFRQILVALSPQLAAMSIGGTIAYPTQLLQQLKSNDTTIHLDVDTTSWIGSIFGLAGIPVIFLPMLMQWKGRKVAYIITCSFAITGWILALSPNNITLIYTTEVFQGLATNSFLPVSFLSISEMLSPRYRIISLQLLSLGLTSGFAIVGILGRFVHTKVICIIMLIPAIVAVVISLFWPESPSWLACKGEFDKCERIFVWLRGEDEASITELKELIAAQREHLLESKAKSKPTVQKFWNQITRRDFYMPSFHMLVLMLMLYGSGGDVILVYFLELVERSSHNKVAGFYGGILVSAIVFLGSLATNIATRFFKNKTILLSSTSGVIVSLICASVVTYLQSVEVLAKNSLLCMFCLIAFLTTNSLGLNAVVFMVAAELMPVKHRSLGGALYVIINCGLYALTLKISPYLMEYLSMWGMFLIFTTNAVACALYVWKYVPETKGRTLQELEDFYTHGRAIKRVGCEVSQLTAYELRN